MSAARNPLSLQRLACVAALLVTTTVAADTSDKAMTGNSPGTTRPQSSGTGGAAPTTGHVGEIPLERLKRTKMPVKKTDVFGAKSWYVPPPPPPPAPPPPPTAPPLPFSFLGKIQEPTGKVTIFLSGVDRVYLVSTGQTIDNTYHVDGIEEGKLALTYLPLQIKQFLDMGDAP
jgi:hypothetical protein